MSPAPGSRISLRHNVARRIGIACFATVSGMVPAACSVPEVPSERPASDTSTIPKATALPQGDTTRVIGKHDRTIAGGRQVCAIDFVYADRGPEDVFWAEPCAAVTAAMVDRYDLEASGRWHRLDAFQQGFVERMPGGYVLQIEGTFSASIYPVDTTGTSIEVAVAD